jgi:membrane-associated protease RseP (regulator of RpoE activity)
MLAVLALIAAMFVHGIFSHQWIGRDELCQCAGYLASVLVLATFAMKNMRLLRITAILSNVAFITYGTLQWLPPVIGLHLLLLPINLVRLIELHGAGRKSRSHQLQWAARTLPMLLVAICALAASHLAAHAEERAWIGVTIADVAFKGELSKPGWSSGAGVLVVHADSPAASAGLIGGDVIVELDGQPIANGSKLVCQIAARIPGSPARLTMVRGMEIRYTSLFLGSWPDDIIPSLRDCALHIG